MSSPSSMAKGEKKARQARREETSKATQAPTSKQRSGKCFISVLSLSSPSTPHECTHTPSVSSFLPLPPSLPPSLLSSHSSGWASSLAFVHTAPPSAGTAGGTPGGGRGGREGREGRKRNIGRFTSVSFSFLFLFPLSFPAIQEAKFPSLPPLPPSLPQPRKT